MFHDDAASRLSRLLLFQLCRIAGIGGKMGLPLRLTRGE
jgi:hypothetical protein